MWIEVPGQGRILAHYGEDAQAMIHMEELAELAQSVSKMRRARNAGRDDTAEWYSLLEEVSDVLICIEQIKEMYGIRDCEIEAMVKKKCARLDKRMEEDRKHDTG